MTEKNEAAERLLDWVEGDAGKRANFRFRVDEALDHAFAAGYEAGKFAERRATVERIRERVDSMLWVEHVSGDFAEVVTESNRKAIRAILDEEAAR